MLAPSQIPAVWPILKVVNTMEKKAPATIHDLASMANARWLAAVLEPARNDARALPDTDTVERMRERIFGERARKARTLAA